MLRRSFFFRVLACVVALFGFRLAGREAEVWGAQVEVGPQPQPLTVYVRFVEQGRYTEHHRQLWSRTANDALVQVLGVSHPNISQRTVSNALVVRGHRSLMDCRSLLK